MAKEVPIDSFRPIDESLVQGPIIKQTPQTKGDNPTAYRSIGTMGNEEIVAASLGQPDPLRGVAVNEAALPAHMRSILDDQEQGIRQGRKPRTIPMKMTGTINTNLPDFVIGDRVYHKVRKKEGVVKDVSQKNSLSVRADGEKQVHWWDPKKVVKL